MSDMPDDLSAEEMRQFPWNAMLVTEASQAAGPADE
jgi:hypothetical protein